MKKLFSMLVIMCLLMVGGTGALAQSDTFLLGVYMPLSGANASYGFELQNSINMAVNHVNANGGMNGLFGK